MPIINLIVADDHDVVREALCEMLRSKGKYKIIGQADNGERLLELLSNAKPDLVIMDISMPKLDGFETLRRLRSVASLGMPPVLILSASGEYHNVKAALNAGAKGYIPKNASFEELEFAISSVLHGKTYLSPSVTENLITGKTETANPGSPLEILTSREREIFKFLAEGLKNREIGKILHISVRTVDTHRSNIMKKLNLRTNAELAKLAVAQGIISV